MAVVQNKKGNRKSKRAGQTDFLQPCAPAHQEFLTHFTPRWLFSAWACFVHLMESCLLLAPREGVATVNEARRNWRQTLSGSWGGRHEERTLLASLSNKFMLFCLCVLIQLWAGMLFITSFFFTDLYVLFIVFLFFLFFFRVPLQILFMP